MSATCDQISGELYAAVRGELPDSQAEEVENHISACGTCRAEKAEMQDLAGLFARQPEPEALPGGFARLRATIEREDRNRRNRLRAILAVPLAAAAALLLAFLLPSSPTSFPSRLTPEHGVIYVGERLLAPEGAVPLGAGDVVRGAGPCAFRLTSGREMEMVIDSDTALTFVETGRFEVSEGRIFATVLPGEGEVVFVTPRGEAVVTGTKFTLTVTEDRTDLAVLEGEVTLRTDAHAPVRVLSGYAVGVFADGPPGDPREVDPWRVREWFSRPTARLVPSDDSLLLILENRNALPLTLKPYDPGSAAYSLHVLDPDGRLEPREVRLQAAMIRDDGRASGAPQTLTLRPGESYRLAIDPDRALPRGHFLVAAVYKPYGELPPGTWRGVLETEPFEITVGD